MVVSLGKEYHKNNTNFAKISTETVTQNREIKSKIIITIISNNYKIIIDIMHQNVLQSHNATVRLVASQI